MCNCNRPVCNTCQASGAQAKMQPHKHAEVIKAWADGAVIEGRSLSFCPTWEVFGQHYPPRWRDDWEYRVRPTPKPLWKVARDSAFRKNDENRYGANEDFWQRIADDVVAAYKEQQK